jgi:hypothetical protein
MIYICKIWNVNMKQSEHYENYPAWMILVANLVSIAIYLAGAFIVYQIGLVWMILYLAFIGYLEIRLLKGHCVDCYYYGKRCAFGKGKACSLFFGKGNPKEFSRKHITWKNIIPDFMVSVIPMVIGGAILLFDFSWLILSLVILLFVLSFPGTGFVRGSLACRHCRQRELGCPVERLFKKK